MNLNTSLNLKMQQKLIMTPKLLQRIQILQMPIQDLATEVQRQLQENPLVEIIDMNDKPDGANYGEKPGTAIEAPVNEPSTDPVEDNLKELTKLQGGEEGREDIKNDSDGISGYEKDAETIKSDEVREIDWEQYYDDLEKTTHRDTTEYEWQEQVSFENFVSRENTLHEHLLQQLNAEVFSDRELMIGKIIIGFINSSGYLKASLEDILKHQDFEGLDVKLDELSEVLEIIQSFDPSGVGARSVRECLLLQYDAIDDSERDPLVKEIIEKHLEDVSEKHYKNIAQALDITVNDVQELVDFIVQRFDPKPGLKYASSDENFTVTPEVFIEKANGEYVVTVNDYGVPRIRLNPRYEVIMRSQKGSKEVMDFIKEKLEKARFILKSIEQRRETIKKVVECIVSHQYDFFEKGIEYFKPLILNEVATEVGLDESTISRVTSGKYAQTPRGVFELKYFFSAGLKSSTGGDDVSTKSVKEMIKNMVLAEPANKPLSDQAIVDMIGEKGIKIARRTVTKYREELKIPPSSKRKRFV
ncbi:MAG: RNA polymerase factor sigma-54 [Candidatus Wallbacteria bacterium]